MTVKKIRSRTLLLLCTVAALVVLYAPNIPTYTRLALVLLVLPSLFIIFRKEEHLDEKRLGVVLLFSIVATIIWDTIAIRLGIWGFPHEATSVWILGIPLEEYLFGMWLCVAVLGIYTSLPGAEKYHHKTGFHVANGVALGIVFVLQTLVLIATLWNPGSYALWALILAVIPSFFYLFRDGEKIDHSRLSMTLVLIAAISVVGELILVPSGSWFYNRNSLMLHNTTGIIPEDMVFAIFNAILIIGFYTSLSRKRT